LSQTKLYLLWTSLYYVQPEHNSIHHSLNPIDLEFIWIEPNLNPIWMTCLT